MNNIGISELRSSQKGVYNYHKKTKPVFKKDATPYSENILLRTNSKSYWLLPS